MPDFKKPTTWLALIGEWDFPDAANIRFNGKPYIDPDGVEKSAGDSPRRAPEENPTHGIALSDLTFSGGTVEAVWVANYYSARNPLRLSSLVILCLPKTSSPHYVHWALLRISRRPASITGHADRLSRTVHGVGLRPAEPGGAPD